MEDWTVSEVARMAHVTVRTLHHYDEIGLLVPSDRSHAGYRLYGAADLQRLHEILLFRELGFSLDAIRRLLDAPGRERLRSLRAQRDLLLERLARTESVIRAVDARIESLERGKTMSADTMFDGFEDFDHSQYEAEVKERWGDTDAYKESMRRTKQYDKQDWARIRAEGESIEARWATLMAKGHRPEDQEVVAIAEAHRSYMDRWFYPVSPEMHVCLSEMYTADPRFREHFEKRAGGLAEFVAASIRANLERTS